MAGPGDLDTTFAGNGKKAITFGATDAARVVLVQRDRKIVLAGGGGPRVSFCVARLRTNGTLDVEFGSRGKRVVDFGGDDEGAFGAALQEDGKIVLVGDVDLQPAIVRLNRNGSVDFKRVFSWGPIGRAMAVVVLPNGKLLLGGFSGPEGGNMQAARLRPNGAFDTSFGLDGVATVDFGGDDAALAMARQANGRIVLAGFSTAVGAVVARLRTNGELDPDFGGDGRVVLGPGRLNAVLVQPDRKIVVAGNVGSSEKMTVTRLMPNGSVDGSFGSAGTATIDFGSTSDLANGAVLQGDGKIVVAGYAQSAEDVAVARLNPDGSLDTTFGTGGKATVDFGSATFGFAVALQRNGRIVVAGQRTAGDDFAVARLLG
jgi:uncharacterized delta-60 repeat protein